VRTLVLGTAGHIDHGKSALVEALTGTHPDRLKEERARGITIELGFAHAQIGDLAVAFVDVPGHERFVRTMLAGAGGVDAVLLVIAANESVMPQTREHFDICRLLGISRGVIVLTKADLVDADTCALAELDARELVAGTALADAPVVAVSAHTGHGLQALRDAIAALGESTHTRAQSGRTRVPIDRAFSVKGFGTVVTGTLVSGTLAEGDTLTLLPQGGTVRVRGVQVHGATVAAATAPRRVAVNLGGVDLEAVHRGMTLAAPDSLSVTSRVDVRLDLLPGSTVLRHAARVRVHHGTEDASAHVSLAAVRSGTEGPWVPVAPGAPDVLVPSGGQAYARLRLTRPMVLTRGDRIVLRLPSPARTIGGGVVLDSEPPRGGVRRTGAATRFLQLDDVPLSQVVALWVEEAGLAGVAMADLARRAGTTSESLVGLLGEGALLCGGGETHVVSRQQVTTAAGTLVDWMTAFHRAQPGEAGAPRESVRAAVAAESTAEIFEAVVRRAGVVQVVNGERLALPAHRPVVTDTQAHVRQVITDVLLKAGLQPPDVHTLAATTEVTAPVVQQTLMALVKERQVVKLTDLWFHAGVLADLREQVRALGAGAVFDVAAAKARFGVSRKFAIPLLEHLDRERITRRVGDKRLVL